MRSIWMIVAVALCFTSAGFAQEKKKSTSKTPAAAAKKAAPTEKVFRAGAATSNVTPFLGELVVGGFSPFPARHVHDELHARCLVLDDGETKLVMVTVDNVSVAREVFDWAKKALEKDTGIPARNMLMSSTHTHSAISARPKNVLNPPAELSDYQAFMARRIVDGVKRALNNMMPAEIGWGTADEPTEVHNRRWFMQEGSPQLVSPFGNVEKVKMNPSMPGLVKPAGPVDPQICFISVRTPGENSRPIALYANYSLHYVGGVGSGHISADYFAVFADRMQQLLGADRLDPPFVGFMSNGTSGNINNINFTARFQGIPAQRTQPYERIKLVADKVASKVFEQYKKTKHHSWVKLDARATEVLLDVRHPSPETVAWAKAELAKPEDPKKRNMSRIYAERALLQADSPSKISVVTQALRIGDLGIAAIPFETFVETGLYIKANSPFKPSFTVSIANGGYGYLPSDEHYDLGGYETWLSTNKVARGSAEKLRDSCLQLLAELKKK